MGSYRQAFLDAIAAARTILRGELGWDDDDGDAMQPTIIAHPGEEQPPTGIADTLCQMVILDHVGDLQVFKSNQVVRLDQRSRSLDREIFTPPLDFQIAFCQAFDRLLTILGPFDFAGDAPMQALELRFRFAE